MLDVISYLHLVAVKHPVLSVLLAAAVLLFILFFIVPWILLRAKLVGFAGQVRNLRDAASADPKQIATKDPRLRHLWHQYCDTLHQLQGAVNPRTGIAQSGHHRATAPAEAIFNAQSVFEGRIHTEFFKHLPGLLTGIGIIGTFLGLIDGLGRSTSGGSSLDTSLLIASVEGAFQVSAAAIILAMVVTFFEKMIVAGLHRRVEQLCQDIDGLYASGAGEEYLARLVTATEESASQSRILKDALVGELSAILERLTQQQIEASAKQQAALVSAIDSGLKQPLGEIAQNFGQFRSQQGDQLAQGLQDSMAAFAEKLDHVLGGQVGQAKELQAQTLHALESAISAFQSMAKQVGNAGESATSTMSAQLNRALDEMASRQGQMNETMRSLVDEMRAVVTRAQVDTNSNVSKLLGDLGKQVSEVVSTLQAESRATSTAHQDRVADMSSQAKETISELATGVRAQTAAIEQTTLAVRAAVSELGSSVNRNITLMGEGAGEMRKAAEQFTGSGRAISEVFDRSNALSLELSRMGSTLSTASQDVRAVVGDYKVARETFASIVDGLKGTVELAKREVGLTSDLVSRLEASAQKLIAAQGEADAYLSKVNAVLAEAHGSFGSQMMETVKRTNTEFHEHLRNSTSLLASTIAELDGAIIEFSPRKRAAG